MLNFIRQTLIAWAAVFNCSCWLWAIILSNILWTMIKRNTCHLTLSTLYISVNEFWYVFIKLEIHCFFFQLRAYKIYLPKKCRIYDKCSDISMYDFFMISIYKYISTLVGPMLNEPRILYMIFWDAIDFWGWSSIIYFKNNNITV